MGVLQTPALTTWLRRLKRMAPSSEDSLFFHYHYHFTTAFGGVKSLFDKTSNSKFGEEDRFVAIGMDALGRILVVVFTWRGDDIRIISARKATPNERRQYEG
jgi:uncharacterized DUF497 family protein